MADIQRYLETYLNELDVGPANTDRIAAMKQMSMSVDQMGGGQTPYTQAGQVKLPANASSAQIAAELARQARIANQARQTGESVSI